ncbi:uncharacterized protein CDAR_267121 [Caerostris darwini]|uniref:Uncharacterized protein n=1 Tax=Caerostris darwini TaxID=1538125 RepID=A0AAV4THN3_9ARAC|nr:uncharacterized protein CDAR_267121 [Caerostris darwini]
MTVERLTKPTAVYAQLHFRLLSASSGGSLARPISLYLLAALMDKCSREIKNDLEKKPTELLDRLKIVKVSSEGTGENPVSNRPLPQERRAMQVPLFGYEEPKVIPEGKCSLRQALAFITKHQNDPTKHSVKSIAEAHFMKESDIENIIKYFRAFEVYISRDGKTTVAKTTLENMGARKIVAPIFKPKFAHLEPQNMPNHDMPPEKK